MDDNIEARILAAINHDPQIPSWAENYFCERIESEVEAMETITDQDIQIALADIKMVFEEATITIYRDHDTPHFESKCFVVKSATFEDLYGHSFDLDLYDVGEEHEIDDNDDEFLEMTIRECLGIGIHTTHVEIMY